VPLRLEQLEDRTLLAVLTPPFNKAVISFGAGLASAANAVAAQPDGKLVVVGWTDAALGHRDFAVVRLLQDGSLDPTFGTGGKTSLQFGNSDDEATGVAIQPDGKIVVAGWTLVNATDHDFAVARLTANGAPDPTFGNKGLTSVSFNLGGGKDDRANAVALGKDAQGNTTIILAGFAQVSDIDYDFAVARLTANGALDPTFGAGGLGGKVTVPFNLNATGANDDRANALTLASDGSIILAGYAQVSATDFDFAIAGVTPVGGLNPNFATQGTGTFSFNQGANNDDRATGVTFRTVAVPHFGPITYLDVSGTVQVSPTDFDFGLIELGTNGKPLPSPIPPKVIPINAIPGGVDQANGITLLTTVQAGYGASGTSVLIGSAQVSANGSNFAFTGASASPTLVSFSADNSSRDVARAGLYVTSSIQPAVSRLVLVGSTQPAGGISSMAVALAANSNQQSQPAVVNPATNTWYLRGATTAGAPNGGTFTYGLPGWTPVSGDWRGFGSAGIGVVDPSTLTWYLRNEASGGAPDAGSFQYGAPGWIPVVGDWDGDSKFTIGAFDPTTATWYLRNSNSSGAPDFTPFQFGAPGWIPVVGDWTGKGKTTIGVVDPATMTWYLRNSNSPGAPDIPPFQFGVPGWVPITGKWDSSGKTGYSVVDPNTATWYLNFTSGSSAYHFQYGAPGWTPVPGQYGIPQPNPAAAVGVAKSAQGTDSAEQSQPSLSASVAQVLLHHSHRAANAADDGSSGGDEG
jgi:uncharacterized delta-60 repeat protein